MQFLIAYQLLRQDLQMELELAKQKFLKLLNEVKPSSVCDFLQWIQNSNQFQFQDENDVILESIVDEIRALVPFEAVFPSEKMNTPSVGKNSDCNDEVLAHVDSFLFSDDYIDELVDAGKFSRNYCNSCGSRNTKPLTFISHSASIQSVKFIFKHALPDLTGKVVIDVGSRLGPILYGAFLFSSCAKIVGIEINADLCDVQNKIISKYGMNEKIAIVNEDVMNCQDIFRSGNVIVMNNVFEFFADQERLIALWRFAIKTLKGSNKLLITIPSLQESLEPLGLLSLLTNFVEELPLSFENFDDIEDIHMYKVLSDAQ